MYYNRWSPFPEFEIYYNCAYAGDLGYGDMNFSIQPIPILTQILNNVRSPLDNYVLCEKGTMTYEQHYNGGRLKPLDNIMKRNKHHIVIYYNKNEDFEKYLDKIM